MNPARRSAMSTRDRARRLIVVLACVSLVGGAAVACATPATSAAQVGSTAISEAEIFDRTTSVVQQVQAQGQPAPDAATVAELNRRQATAAIRSQLLQVAADDVGVSVTDEQVNAALAGSNVADTVNQLGAPQSMLEQTVRDLLRLEGLVSVQAAAGAPVTNVVIRIDGVSVTSRDEAVKVRSQFLADPASADAVIAAAAAPVDARSVTILQTPTVAPTGVFAADVGDVLLYPNPDGYFVVRVLERSVEPGTLTVEDLSAQQLAGQFDLGALLLAPYAAAAGVTVNPRLGVWDPLTLQVIPGGSGL